MSDELNALVQGLTADDFVELFELDATILGGSVYRFCSSVNDGGPVVFGGETFPPLEFETTGWEYNGKGALPTPRIKIGNATKVISAIVFQYDDLRGALVTRIRTFRQFLDDGDSPDPTAMFSADIYKVERKVAQNKLFVEFELSAALDQEGRMIPGRQVIRDHCTHIYRTWDATAGAFSYAKATCPYTGTDYFDDQNAPTASASSDKCSKLLLGCQRRFGTYGPLPTRAFPGAAKFRSPT